MRKKCCRSILDEVNGYRVNADELKKGHAQQTIFRAEEKRKRGRWRDALS